MIVGVTGFPGAGKSLYLVETMHAELRSRPRLSVFTNLDLVPAGIFNKSEWSRLFRLNEPAPSGRAGRVAKYVGPMQRKGHVMRLWSLPPDSLIVLDEVDDYFDSLDFSRESNGGFRSYIKQHRHYGHTLLWATQKMLNVYVRLRRQTHKQVVCHSTTNDPFARILPSFCQTFIREHYLCGDSSRELFKTEWRSRAAAIRFGQCYQTVQLHGRTKNLSGQ